MMIRKGQTMSSVTWQRMWPFESREVVAELYSRRHGVPPDGEKAIEISTCLAQGHQFFDLSQDAGELAKPLLLFYGTVALAQGLILFLNPNAWLKNLAPSHGIGSQGWKRCMYDHASTIPNAQPAEALNVPLELQARGTFVELLLATQNAERCAIQATELEGPLALCVPGSSAVSSRHVKLKDVLASLPDLRLIFERSLGERSRCFVGMAITSEADVHAAAPHKETSCCVLESNHGLPSEDQMRSMFGLGNDVVFSLGSGSKSGLPMIHGDDGFPDILKFRCFQWRHHQSNSYGGLQWPVKNDAIGRVHLIPPFGGVFTLSSLALLYLASFALGTLARYHPTISQSIQSRLGSDRFFPLVRATMDLISDRYPELILAELEDAEFGRLVKF